MARKRERIIALSIAIIFFLTSLTLTIMAIWHLYADNRQANNVNQTNSPLPEVENLVGTKLEDFEPLETVESLQVIDLVEGTGKEVQAGDIVMVDYVGALAADGTIFEATLGREPATFGLDGVIEGWGQGIPGMKEGGKRRLIIPAEMAYGDQERPSIPANSPLVFDVSLLAVIEE